jgi:hypothetical protein
VNDTTDHLDPATAPADVPETLAVPRVRGGLRRALPWVVTVLALALAGVSTWQWQTLAAREAAATEVRAAAEDVLRVLTTWDADELATTRASLQDAGTEDFAAEVAEQFGPEATAALVAARTRSEGTVEDVFVQSLEGGRATVFAVVTQTLVSDDTDGEAQPATRASELRLVQVDGRWLVDAIDIIEPTIAEVAG